MENLNSIKQKTLDQIDKEYRWIKSSGMNVSYRADIKAWTTKDYDKFKPLLGQRDVSPHNLSKKIRFLDNYLDGTNGELEKIKVNERFEIIDGQHRIEIAKKFNLEVPFEIIEGWGIKTTRVLNSNIVNWSASTHLKSIATEGKREGFRKFQRFIDEFNTNAPEGQEVPIGAIAATVLDKYSGLQERDIITDRDIEIKDENEIRKHLNFLREVRKIKLERFNPKHVNIVLACALLFLIKKAGADPNELLKVLERESFNLTPQTGIENYMGVLEEMYNFRKRDGKRIDVVNAFKDYKREARAKRYRYERK